MKTSNEILFGVGIVAAIGAAFYFVSKASNTVPAAPVSSTATNPQGVNNPTGTASNIAGQGIDNGTSLWGFLTGFFNNSGSTNSTSGTNATNNGGNGTGWLSTGIDDDYGDDGDGSDDSEGGDD